MARKNDQAESQPATERDTAPDTVATIAEIPQAPVYIPPAPRQMRVERQGSASEPYTRRFPQIRGGTCEFCGVMDRNQPAHAQYKLCPHYRGMQARCTYCPENADPDQVVGQEILNVAEHPDAPGTLIMWCGKYDCSRAHERRFRRVAS